MKTILLALLALASPLAVLSADVSVVIEGNDQMKFNKQAFTVKSGQTVTLLLKNVGHLPKEMMGHNLVILKEGVDKMKFAAESVKAGMAAEYVGESQKEQVIAYTRLLGPGESDTITFEAPAPGKYEYICSFLGHAGIMNGVMTVTE
ncbi:MAG: plastocyanin/azurin family copper-binding protein [Verrucomicrobiota bacterium]